LAVYRTENRHTGNYFPKHISTNCSCAANRLNNFVVGLTNTDPATTAPVYKQYYHVQYNGALAVLETATVSFPPYEEAFRYVIIQQQFTSTQAICLREVEVYAKGMQRTQVFFENSASVSSVLFNTVLSRTNDITKRVILLACFESARITSVTLQSQAER